jgi:dolichol-phosphate mannosyltransferase
LSSPKNDVFFSIVMPAHNEEANVGRACEAIVRRFAVERIVDYEIVVVNDHSSDRTADVLKDLEGRYPRRVRHVDNSQSGGFGFAVRKGLECFKGESVCIVMADLSDSPDDIVLYYRKLKEGNDCVFGSRFMKGSVVINYPGHKLAINRMANLFIRVLFGLKYNDVTNAFKAYRREVIDGVQPLLSNHFNLTVELPLKAIVRGFRYEVVPVSWTNRTVGQSNLLIKEMGSRYMFIVLYCWLEKTLSRHDYYRTTNGNCV